MKRDGVKFKLPRARFSVFLGIFYFTAVMSFMAHIFIPGVVDASSEERLFIPKIGLIARVKDIERQGNQLIAPDTIAGAYKAATHKTVIIGHSSTIFKDLKNLEGNETFTFDNKSYKITSREIIEKQYVNMEEVVSETEKDTIVLMTCHGESLGGQDYSHRLVITAEEV